MQPASDQTLPLRGIGVLVTRPVAQAQRLCCLLEALGARAIRFPVLDILAPLDPTAALALVERLDDFDMAIFTSANAVEFAIPIIREHNPAGFDRLRRVAIGKATAAALVRAGTPAHILPPPPFNSEVLLAMASMQTVADKRIIIFRGEGGRELLGGTLAERGANISYAEVYRRARPDADPRELIKSWQRGEIQAVLATSNESLRNLFDMVGELGQQYLCSTLLILVSPRARDLARSLGFRQAPLLAEEASDEAIVEALLKWYQTTVSDGGIR